MNLQDDLFAIYREWRELSEAEGEAIQLASWPKVTQCQSAKSRLQPQIVAATERLHADATWLMQRDAVEYQIRSIVSDLIQLENRNNGWLDLQRKKAQIELERLDQSSRNLRQVHRAYSPGRQVSWNSYS